MADLSGIRGELIGLDREGYPLLRITLDEKALGQNAFDLVNRLLEDDPGVAVGQDGAQDGYITLKPILESYETANSAPLARRMIVIQKLEHKADR